VYIDKNPHQRVSSNMNFLKKNIVLIFYSYLVLVFLLHILPVNGQNSILNNNYIFKIRLDYIGHFILFGLLSWLGLIYWKLRNQNIYITITIIVFLALGYEIIQYFIPWRTFNINDLVANGVGMGLGMIVFFLFIKFF